MRASEEHKDWSTTSRGADEHSDDDDYDVTAVVSDTDKKIDGWTLHFSFCLK